MAVYFTGKPEDRGRFRSALMISNHPIREAEAACASTAPPHDLASCHGGDRPPAGGKRLITLLFWIFRPGSAAKGQSRGT